MSPGRLRTQRTGSSQQTPPPADGWPTHPSHAGPRTMQPAPGDPGLSLTDSSPACSVSPTTTSGRAVGSQPCGGGSRVPEPGQAKSRVQWPARPHPVCQIGPQVHWAGGKGDWRCPEGGSHKYPSPLHRSFSHSSPVHHPEKDGATHTGSRPKTKMGWWRGRGGIPAEGHSQQGRGTLPCLITEVGPLALSAVAATSKSLIPDQAPSLSCLTTHKGRDQEGHVGSLGCQGAAFLPSGEWLLPQTCCTLHLLHQRWSRYEKPVDPEEKPAQQPLPVGERVGPLAPVSPVPAQLGAPSQALARLSLPHSAVTQPHAD